MCLYLYTYAWTLGFWSCEGSISLTSCSLHQRAFGIDLNTGEPLFKMLSLNSVPEVVERATGLQLWGGWFPDTATTS